MKNSNDTIGNRTRNISERKDRNSSNFGSHPFVNVKELQWVRPWKYRRVTEEVFQIQNFIHAQNKFLIVHIYLISCASIFVSSLLHTGNEYRTDRTHILSV
jgi:hypothetical protein